MHLALIIRAFINNSETEYVLAYNNCLNDSDNTNVLYVRMQKRTGRSDKVTSIGCFSLLEHGQSAYLVRFNVGLNEDLQDCLSEILRQESKPKQKKKQKRAITTTPRNSC